jgi:5'-nucleotidase
MHPDAARPHSTLQRSRSRVTAAIAGALCAALIGAACGGDDAADAAATSVPVLTATAVEPAPATTEPAPATTELATTTTESAPATAAPTTVAAEPVQILVTNDDGVDAAGIDAVVEALRSLDGVEVTVVAPAEQQSGTGGSTTDGPVEAVETTTASGYPAIAVDGFPADSVNWAMDGGIDVVPDLVVSGINEGQNLGPFVDLSGTVGAARAAATRGIPSIAISQGFSATEGGEPDFAAGAAALLDYLDAELESLVGAAPDTVVNINVPTCAAGTAIRGVAEVPTEPIIDDMGLALTTQDCSSTGDAPPTEVAAFTAGYVTITEVSTLPAA